MDTIVKNVFVAGGLAGDAFHCGVTFVFTKDFISSNGVVGVSLNRPPYMYIRIIILIGCLLVKS